MNLPNLQELAQFFGVHGVQDIALAHDADVNYSPVTGPNSGVPAIFTTYTDPKIIQALITPTKAEDVFGVARKGDWLTDTAQFPVVELSGNVASYEDYSQAGTTDPNANWVQRQSYHFQTWTKWGEREVERMGAAKLDWINQKNAASISVLNKAQNLFSLFGVQGLRAYGALNDPNLPAAITPTPKGDGTGWNKTNDPLQIYADILMMFSQLTVQMGGNVDLESRMTLVIPTERQSVLALTNMYNVKLREIIEGNFPNLTIKSLPEAGSTLSGGYSKITQAMLFLDEIDGQETRTTAFTEKLRAHTVERYSSYVRQKKSQGTWGTIWFYPVACVTMAGV